MPVEHAFKAEASGLMASVSRRGRRDNLARCHDRAGKLGWLLSGDDNVSVKPCMVASIFLMRPRLKPFASNTLERCALLTPSEALAQSSDNRARTIRLWVPAKKTFCQDDVVSDATTMHKRALLSHGQPRHALAEVECKGLAEHLVISVQQRDGPRVIQ